MNIEIRRYLEEDYKFVKDIIFHSFEIKMKDYFITDNQYDFVVCIDGVVGGYFLLTKNFNPIEDYIYFYLYWVCVLENYRNIGIGNNIINFVFDFCNKFSSKYVELTSSDFRKVAHHLYLSNGFEIRNSNIFRKVLR